MFIPEASNRHFYEYSLPCDVVFWMTNVVICIAFKKYIFPVLIIHITTLSGGLIVQRINNFLEFTLCMNKAK